jgi:membrane protease YdiL (CAAX protease family)
VGGSPLFRRRVKGGDIVTPSWGLGDVLLGFFAGEVLSALVYALVTSTRHFATGSDTGTGFAVGQAGGALGLGRVPSYVGPMPLWLTAVIQIPLWACLLGVPILATVFKGNGPRIDLGLKFKPLDVPIGLAIGVLSQLVLVPLVYWPVFKLFGDQDVSAAARQLTDRATDPLGIIMLFLIVGIGAPVAEEIFFRGLTQRSLGRRFGPWVAVIGTAAFFALTHFEPLQFLPLFSFALILGFVTLKTGRLGISISAHLAFNLVAAAALVWSISLPG